MFKVDLETLGVCLDSISCWCDVNLRRRFSLFFSFGVTKLNNEAPLS